MNWMWLIIPLVIGLIASPIIAIMPSKQQRAKARLRAHANQLGLRVRLAELTAKNAKDGGEILPVYSLMWGSDAKPLAKQAPWQLVRTKYEHDIHAFGSWDWASPALQPNAQWQQLVGSLLRQAGEDALLKKLSALEWNAQGVQVYWHEGQDLADVDRIQQILAALKAAGLNPHQTLQWPTAIQAEEA